MCCCCSRGPGPSWFSVFSFFIFSVFGAGGGVPVVLLSVTACILFLLVFCERWLLASFAVVDGLPSLCNLD